MNANTLSSTTAMTPPSVDQALPDITAFLNGHFGARNTLVRQASRLSGGAIQENWLLLVEQEGGSRPGEQRLVLRTDAPSSVAVSMTRAQEFAVLRCAFEAGAKVPEPLVLCADLSVLGREFFIMQALDGTAFGPALTRDAVSDDQRSALCRELGVSLASLHRITPPHPQLEFLPAPAVDHAQECIDTYRRYLDTLSAGFPALEWGLRWCELNRPAPLSPRLLHRDYRTGNYMVADGRLSGILDWEFAGWGDPREDIGWFTARCWRFAGPQREAGGVGELEDFFEGYNSIAPLQMDRAALTYWQVMAHLRWAIIALQQAERYMTDGEDSLELALTGRMLSELEQEILLLTGATP